MEHNFTSYQKFYSKSKILNVEVKTIPFIEDNIRENLHEFELRKHLLGILKMKYNKNS